jgi:hypothetical protein
MNRSIKRVCLLISLVVVPLAAASAGAETPAGSAAKVPKAVPLSGKVLETVEGGGYTYVHLKNGDDKVWVAVPHMKVTVGQQLSLVPGYEMKNFSSKSMNRKFDRLVFSAGVANQQFQLPPEAVKMAHQMTGAKTGAKTAPAAAAGPTAKEAAAPIKVGKVAKAKGPNAYSVAELYAKKAKLQKKQITVRGKVVKVAERILKHNWIHIQDGTGSAARKNNSLTITTRALPRVGQVVTVSGTLYNNVNFGSGYRYDVLVDASRIN